MSNIDEAIARLDDPDEVERKMAVADLIDAGAAAMLPLLSALADPRHFVREGAATALGKVPDPSNEVIQSLVAALDDPIPEVRVRAMSSLGNSGQKAMPFLLEAMDSLNSDVQGRAVIALTNLGVDYTQVFSRLADFLENGQSFVALQSAIALARLGNSGKTKLVEVLRESLSRKEFERAQHCLTALEGLDPTRNDDVCCAFVDAFFRGDNRIEHEAARCLGIRRGTKAGDIEITKGKEKYHCPRGKVAENLFYWLLNEAERSRNAKSMKD